MMEPLERSIDICMHWQPAIRVQLSLLSLVAGTPRRNGDDIKILKKADFP